ncbi:TerB family tellurite resistance protein [Oscillatoria sp. CS-180]|uniref:tellurite resistance TerB family protein n=1 Tax=Oscillatoria sp. CS-180 TaxID=3021720 RepID=UPI00232B9B38|nr:TerB family tellurite resistance protein [Oscillatoria sp. CS-180]MDB9525149.1 TerB family tellurite resistance protein [Oscillatoria sp. CS-180]
MALQVPPPPSISPRQMTLMRIVASMAWSDGELATEEVDLMLERFSSLFAQNAEQQSGLQKELRDYLMQNIPLEESVPKLQSQEEREFVLRLGYEVISSSSRTPEEDLINSEEEDAYVRLVKLLDLPSETVQRLEADIETAGSDHSVVDSMTEQLRQFFNLA